MIRQIALAGVVLFAGCGNDTTFADGYDEIGSGNVSEEPEASAPAPPTDPSSPSSPSPPDVPDPTEEPIDDPPPAEPSCKDDSSCDVCPISPEQTLSDATFANVPQLERSGPFRVEFTVRVTDPAGDAFVALALGDMDFFDDASAMIRFAPEGVFNARDADQFAADVDYPYTANQWYHVIFDVDPAARSYDVALRECDGAAPSRLIEDARFRSDKPDVYALDTISLWTQGNATLEVAGVIWN